MNAAIDLKAFEGAYLTRSRMILWLLILSAVLMASLILAASFGSAPVNLIRAVTDSMSADHAIFFGVRLPRVLMGAVVGAVLASAGVALQALVRNPLAEGGILGISGGAALGAILALVMSAKLGGGEALVPLFAFGA